MSTYTFTVSFSKTMTGGAALAITQKDLFPPALTLRVAVRQVVVLGSPIYRGRLDRDGVAKAVLESGMQPDLISELDGSFLLLRCDEKEGKLTIATDRFASIPLFYFMRDKAFFGSIAYSEVWNQLRKKECLNVNAEAFYEFICLQRLLGNKTYDTQSKYLDSASLLEVDIRHGTLKQQRYWRPDFTKRIQSASEASAALAEATRDSIARRVSDNRRFALLLSGGLDSRLVLAGLPSPVACVTVGPRENNEYAVARQLAQAKGCPHSFVKRTDTHYSDIIEEAVRLGGAMNMFSHAHFLQLGEALRQKADVFLHGWGFDFLFQGKYLPYSPLTLFGKKTYMRRRTVLGDGVKDVFLSGISFRLKSIDPLSIVTESLRPKMKDALYSSVEDVLRDGRDSCRDAYDYWEYLIVHNISRHYTYLNLSSIRTFAEARSVAFDNALFNLYLSLTPALRFDRRVFADAIRLLDKRLCEIRNANTNFNMYDSDIALTCKVAAHRLLRGLKFSVVVPPKDDERSWPAKASLIRDNRVVRQRARALVDSGVLEGLPFIDMDSVRQYVDSHFEGKGDFSDLILTLLTIEAFFNLSREEIAVA